MAWSAERLPAGRPRARISTGLTLACAVLAMAPDLDLLVPGMHRTATHSITAALLVTIIAAAVTGWVTRKIDWRVATICGLAYASHLVFDWVGADPNVPSGIQLWWPFSHRWFIAAWTIFPGTERRDVFSAASLIANVTALAVEVGIFGPVVFGLWRLRRK